MNIREVKKVARNLESLVKQHDQATALIKFIENPENEWAKNHEQLKNCKKRVESIESQIKQILNIN